MKYEDNRPAGVYSTAEDRYVMFANGNWRTRCDDRLGPVPDEGASAWETVVKVSEQGTWRGLVLADRSARWCVFAEWECI